MNLFAGKKWRRRRRDGLTDTAGGGDRVGRIEKVALACTLSRVTQVRAGKLVAQGAQARALG